MRHGRVIDLARCVNLGTAAYAIIGPLIDVAMFLDALVEVRSQGIFTGESGATLYAGLVLETQIPEVLLLTGFSSVEEA